MNEIGGYFGLEELIHREYYPDLIAVNNARNALHYILKARHIEKIYIPYFLCDSVSDLCSRLGYCYESYHIGADFLPQFEKTLGTDEYLYVVNYYGQIGREKAEELKKRYRNIVFDNVQAFFQKPVEGIDTVYSCRKFFGVPDGGYVSTTARVEEPLSVDISMDRMRHILGRYEGCAHDYYADFKENDHSFKALELRAMSKLTHNLLGAIDYEAVKQKREENFRFLWENLQYWNKLDIVAPVGPYAYPFYCEHGMEIKKKLAEKRIFVATLWPNVLDINSSLEKDYAENILPLPCDQRYDAHDMQRIADELLKCMGI